MAETDQSRFAEMYAGQAPWDIGRPQQVIVRVTEQVRGRVLDVGCGTGEAALHFAARGLDVVGVDYLAAPIEQARRKAQQRNLPVDFRVGDALELTRWPDRFDTLIDCGLYHSFPAADRQRYVAGLTHVTNIGGQLFMICFSPAEPGDQGPHRISEDELRNAFANRWRIDSLRPDRFEVIPDCRMGFTEGGPQAWFLIASRI